MKNQIIKGTLILGISSIIAKFLGIFFRWPLVMLMGDEGIGYYQMTYPLYMFFVGIVSGMPIAISKLVSERVACEDNSSIFNIARDGIKIMFVLGLGTSLILLLFSNQIIYLLKWDQKVYFSLLGISFAPFSIAFLGVLRGIFQGTQNMIPTGISQILEQIGRVVIGVSLAIILFPKGIEIAAGGAAFGATVGGFIATIFLFIVYYRFKNKNKKYLSNFIRENTYVSKILKIAIPLSLGATVSTIMVLIDSIIVPQRLLNAGYAFKDATILYGQLTGKVAVLTNVPLTLSIALGASIIPVLSRLFILNKTEDFKEKVIIAFKLSSFIAFPCFIGLYFLSSPIMNVIFPGNSDGFEILKYASVSIPFIIFSQVSTSILQSTSKYIKPIINLLIGCVAKIILTITLTGNSKFNIYGAVIATIIAYIITSYLNFRDIRIKLNVNLNILDIIIWPLFSSLFMIILALISFNFIYSILNNILLSLICSLVVGVLAYILSMIIVRKKEMKNIFLGIK